MAYSELVSVSGCRQSQDDLLLKKRPRKLRELTPEQREELKQRFKNRKTFNQAKFTVAYNKIVKIAEKLGPDVGKSSKACLRILMQLARIAQAARKTSLWNAYVAICYDERDKGKLATHCFRAEYLCLTYIIHNL